MPVANSKFSKLQIGMSIKQVTDLTGEPTDQGAYVTGKAFIPFFFGADRYRRELSLVMFDIDHFKKINDSYGHLAGDYVLKYLAQTVKSKIRREDCFARYGGEEFSIVLPEIDGANAKPFAEKIRQMVEKTDFKFENTRIPGLLSYRLDDETQLRKLFALEAMHDLRMPPLRLDKGDPFEVLLRRLGQAFELVRRDPFGDYSYFRRAVRPNELFFVYPPESRPTATEAVTWLRR